jgi:hypothetical protein
MSALSEVLNEFADKAIEQDFTCRDSIPFRNARMTGIMAVEIWELRAKVERLESKS